MVDLLFADVHEIGKDVYVYEFYEDETIALKTEHDTNLNQNIERS